MNTFVAINLSGPTKLLLQVEYGYAHDGNLLVKAGRPWDPGIEDRDPQFWARLRGRLALPSGAERTAAIEEPGNHLEARFRPELQSRGEALRRALQRAASGAPHVVVYPYCTSPVQRRYLPVLLGLTRLRVKDAMHEHHFGLEAPVALALEAVARGVIRPPADLVLVTEAGPGRELSIVTLHDGGDRDPETLRVQVRHVSPIAWPSDPAVGPRLRRALASARDVVLVAEESDGLAASLGLDRIRVADPRDWAAGPAAVATALGAIRHAGTLLPAGERLRLCERYASVAIQGCCPHPVGVIGMNRAREWIWGRLIPAGTPLPSDDVTLVTDRDGPTRRDEIVMAECLNPSYRDRSLLHQEDWEAAELVIHEHRLPPANATSAIQPASRVDCQTWTFRLQDDEQGRWRRPAWGISYSPPPAIAETFDATKVG